MSRAIRSDLPDGFFHVTARGILETPIYVDDADRRTFLKLLRRSAELHEWTCYAFCLMTTHYHLVVACTRSNLSDGLHRVNGLHARRFNRRHGRFGHLFAERFSVRVIDSEDYLFDTCSYVVLNPVKARLCDRAEDWPWSYSSFGLETA